MNPTGADVETARGFAGYHKTIGVGSRYSPAQFRDYFSPLDPDDFRGKEIVELGFGHGSWLWHWTRVGPGRLSGCDLAETIEVVRQKLADVPASVLNLQRGDLTTARLGEHDLAYCIGVLHHLQDPEKGFEAVLRHVKPGGRFHCWVYAWEGNALVRRVIEPLRRLAGRLPWWVTKWVLGLAVAVPLFLYARLLRLVTGDAPGPRAAPFAEYALSIGGEDFGFFHFLVTDFLVARHTVFLDRTTLERWLDREEIEPDSVYLLHHRGNAWKFGGRRRGETRRAASPA